jgi:hypothetical protein
MKLNTEKSEINKLLDKYYTSDNTANKCFDYITEYINIDKSDLCIEPSAGNGSFIKYIKLLSNNYNFYDLEPENDEIIKMD